MEERFSDHRISQDIYLGSVRLLRKLQDLSIICIMFGKAQKAMHTDCSDAYRCNCLVIIFVLGLSGYYYRANRQADKGEKIIEGSKEFRYTI